MASADVLGLKRKLSELRYHQPLGAESAPLVATLVADLVAAHEQAQELRTQADAQAQELILAQNQV